MSLSQNILIRMLNTVRKNGEYVSTQLFYYWPRSARLIAVGGAVYCSGNLFALYMFAHSHSIGFSMYPTMPKESLILVDRRKMFGKGFKIGDVVQFTSPIFKDQQAGKRIIGMPGDYIIRDEYCSPTVGGAVVPGITDWRSEEEIKQGVELKDRTEPEMIQIPEGHVWVAGDNMAFSRDSRFYGAMPMALINGKTVVLMDGLFSWMRVRNTMTKIPKEREEEYLAGRWDPTQEEVE